MSVRADVLLWAQRVLAKKDAQPHQLLDIKADAGIDEAQAAFHRIAKMSHPDLHRTTLVPEELEQVTTAYARVAGAYQDFRTQRMTGGSKKPTGQSPPARTTGQIPPIAKPDAAAPAAAGPASAMTSKALVYYRKAESALRRGDLRGAVLQLKLAIAADPLSGFLRTALTEVESEVSKKT